MGESQPFCWLNLGFVANEFWGDNVDAGIARPAKVHKAPMSLLTGEDERNGAEPKDFDGMIRLGLHSDREVEDAAFRLCQALKYDAIPLRETNEIGLVGVSLPEDISDDLVEIAKWYIRRGNGVDGLITMFDRAGAWQDGDAMRCNIIDFVLRLRFTCGRAYNGGRLIYIEISSRSHETINRNKAGKRGWLWRNLQAAITNKINVQ